MPTEIIVAIVSLLGTIIGSLAGILASSHLTTYRIEQLEKKVDKHNSVVERGAVLERDNENQWTKLDDIGSDIKEIRQHLECRTVG